MSVPGFEDMMLPLLQFASDGKEHTIGEYQEFLVGRLKLTPLDLAESYPRSGHKKFRIRSRWANVYLAQAGLISRTGRGKFKISDLGQQALSAAPKAIDVKFLQQFEAFKRFQSRSQAKESADAIPTVQANPPEEVIDAAYQNWRGQFAEELLERVTQSSLPFSRNWSSIYC